MSTPKIHFLLPAYNEAENIELQIDKLIRLAHDTEQDFTITVIDDGSTDQTADLVKKLQQKNKTLHLTSHPKNSGPGVAFDTGFREIFQRAKPDDAIISMDADNTHSEGTIKMMYSRLAEGYELVIASVYAPGGMFIGVPFIRYVLSIGCNLLYRIFFPINGIKEYTGFYRAYKVGALQNAYQRFESSGRPLISAAGFASAAELVVKLRQIPLFMTEVPMMVRYDQKGGKSKLKIGKTIMEHLKIIGSNFFRRRVI